MRLFHRHHWTSVRAKNGRLRTPLVPNSTGTDVTMVLQRCPECGDVRTVELTGHWTLDEVTGRQAQEVSR